MSGALGGLLCLTACAGSVDDSPDLSPDEREALDQALDDAAGKADGFGLAFFETSYVNLALAGESELGDFALVAGSHEADFPYWETEPWDNGLLYLGGEGYQFTQRINGEALAVEVDVRDQEPATGTIRYEGTMVRVSDGSAVQVVLDIPVSVRAYDARHLGKPYVFLDLRSAERVPGMRWRPFEITSAGGNVEIDGAPEEVSGVHGELEHGVVANLRAPELAFSYDYVSLARPGPDGYAFVDFVSHPLYRRGILGRVLDWYLTRYASASLTLQQGQHEGNIHGVTRPPQDDPTVVLFENVVDLGLADLHRQMIRTRDELGEPLYGLREIFEPK